MGSKLRSATRKARWTFQKSYGIVIASWGLEPPLFFSSMENIRNIDITRHTPQVRGTGHVALL